LDKKLCDICEDFTVKIGDFSMIIHIPPEAKGLQDVFGEDQYLCPEVSQLVEQTTECYYDTGVDIWALGVLAYEMVTGAVPSAQLEADLLHF
jgi:serine/threonine protein kinase